METEYHTFSSLENVCDGPLLDIMSYLNYKDLTSLGSVSHNFQELSRSNCHWKRQCRIYFGITVCPEEKTWREIFIEWFSDFGRYINIYLTVRRAWTQIESYMEQHCPKIFASLQVGATEVDLEELERDLGMRLPLDIRCIYRIHNGQNIKQNQYGLFGTIRNYDHYRSEQMLPLKFMKVPDSTAEGLSSVIQLTSCSFTSTKQFLALVDTHGLRPGHVFYQSATKDYRDLFLSGESYLKWFTDYAQDVANDRFIREEGHILRFYDDPRAVATTQHVRIAVSTTFVPELSTLRRHNSKQLLHAYKVSISMDAEVSKRYACKLQTRHWVITDENGKVSKVDGPGVIGEYPVIYPGTNYYYISCTHFETDSGSMKGTFTMKNLTTDEMFDAEVPEFHMRTYPYVCATDQPLAVDDTEQMCSF